VLVDRDLVTSVDLPPAVTSFVVPPQFTALLGGPRRLVRNHRTCSSASAMHVLPMPHTHDVYDELRVAHLAGHPIAALPYAVKIAARKLLTARWPCFVGETLNPADDALPVSLCRKGFEFSHRRRLDEHSISCHCV
jgi:hypothetical protein